tara:strand:- start:456 stop:2465 length:2010 start_codon:yes stop_codon:yes gene_type:complete
MRVLLAEDAQGMRKLISTMLQGMGAQEIIVAGDGAEAWNELGKNDVDIVLTDWNMPLVNGLELVKRVRGSAEFSDLPIIMFTARAAKEDVLTALQSGVDTYITKPFTPQELSAKIRAVLNRRGRTAIQRIFSEIAQITRKDNFPLVLIGEANAHPSQIGHEDNRSSANFLSAITSAVQRVDDRMPDYKLGYTVSDSTSDLSRLMHVGGDRVKMLIISSNLPGGGINLARMVSLNSRGSMRVFVACEDASEMSDKERDQLERLDVSVFERQNMFRDNIEQLVTETIVAAMSEDTLSELPSPTEIRKRIENDVRNMVDMPVLPQVYHDIMELDKDDDSDIHDWVAAVETDPLTQAQIIRRSRSPLYGFKGEIHDVSKAVILLGKNTVKEVVASSAVKRSVEGIEEQGFVIEDYWLHSVAVGITARIISFVYDEKKWTARSKKDFEELDLGEEAVVALKEARLWEKFAFPVDQLDPFIGGMMHDIGKVALVQCYPGIFPLIVNEMEAQKWNVPMSVGEGILAGGANHNLAGRVLSESWKLGSGISEMIESHHSPSTSQLFAQVISLADFMSGCVFPYPKNSSYPMASFLEDTSLSASAKEPPEIDLNFGDQDETQEQAAEKYDGLSREEAIHYFLPQTTLNTAGGDLNALIQIARLIKPTVSRITNEMRKTN